MSVNVNGVNLFTKEMTSVFQTEVIECPDCGFEFASKHEQNNAKGCYECPCCSEANLDAELFQTKKALEDIKEFINWVVDVSLDKRLVQQGENLLKRLNV